LFGYALAIWTSVARDACLTLGHCLDLTFSFGWARCLAGFFAGALVAEFRDRAAIAALVRRVPQVLTFAAALLFLLFADRVPGAAFAAPAIFVALIASLSRDSGPLAWLFTTHVAQYLGRLSYSLYLVHAALRPLVMIAAYAASSTAAHVIEGVLFLLTSLALAHWLNRLIETPYRDYFCRLSSVLVRSRSYSRSSVSQ
jgi:peptidoglycan/LPS O-acetylase OafA/YrhL